MIVKKIISPGLCFFVVCLFVIMSYGSLCAENQKPLEILIAEKLDFKLKNPGRAVDTNVIFSNYDGDSVVAQAIQLTKDPNESTKEFGYALLSAAGRKLSDTHLRKTIAQAFVDGLKDKGTARFCAKALMKCGKKDFSKEAKAGLKQHFEEVMSTGSQSHHAIDVILLIGVADMQTEMDRLQAIIDQVDEPLRYKSKSNQWMAGAIAALKARARMGDKDAIQRCISLVDSESDEDYKVATLLKQIEYIRQPEAVEYIKQFLYSDKVPLKRGVDIVVTPYSRRAAANLEKMILGFPTWIEAYEFRKIKGATDLEFRKKWQLMDYYYPEYCRQWLESQTSIEIIR